MKNEGNKENEFSVLSMDSLTSFADSTDDWIPHRRSRRGDESNESYELPEIETPNKNGPHSCVPEPIDTPFISKLANFHVSSKEDIRQNNKSPGLEVSTDSNKLMTNRRDAGFKNSTSSVNNASKNSTKETIEVKDGQKDKEIDEKENKKDQNTARENVVEEIVSKSATKIPLSPILTSETSGQLSLETEVESTVQNQNTSELESKVTYPTTSTTTNRDTTASVSTTTINSENNAVLNDSNFRDASSLQFRETVSDALGINNKSNANELSDENDYIKHSNKISSSQQKDPQRNQYSNINYDYQHQHNQVQKLQPSTTSQDKLLARNFPSQEGDNPFLDAGIPLPSPLDPVGQDKSTFSPLSPLSPSIMTKASNSFNRSENDLSKSNNGKPFYFYNDEDRESIATTKEPSSVQETITIGVREEKTQVDMLKSTIFALQVKLHILENTKNGSLPTNVIDLQKQLAEERAWRLTAQNEVKRLNDALSKLRNQTKQREGEDQERLLLMSKQQQMMQMADNNDMQEFVNQYNDALEELADVHNQLLDTREQLEQTQQENILLNQTLQESTKITDNAAVEDLLHKLNLENDSLRRSLDDGEPKFSSVLTKKRTLLLDTLRDTADLLDCDLDDHFDLDDVGYCPECGSEDINIVFEVARIIQKAVVIRIREYDELAQDNEALNDEKFALDRQIRTLYRNLNHANSKKQEAVNLTKVVTERCEQLQQKMDELNKNASNFKNGMEVLDTILEVVRQFYQSKIDVSNISEYIREGFENLTELVSDRDIISKNLESKEKELLSIRRDYESNKTNFEEHLSVEKQRREELERRVEELDMSREIAIEPQMHTKETDSDIAELMTEKQRLQKKLDQSKKAYKNLESQWTGALAKLKEFKSWRSQDASQAEELEGEIKRLSSKLRAKDEDWNALLAVLDDALNEASLTGLENEDSLSERLEKLLAAKDKALKVYEKEFEDLGMGVTKLVKIFVDKSKIILQDDFSPSLETHLEQTVFKHKTNINRITSMEKVFSKILDMVLTKLKRVTSPDYDPTELASNSQDEIRMLKRRIVSLKHQVKEAYELESLEASDKEKVMIARYFEMETRYEEERERHKEDYDAFQTRVKQCDQEIQQLRQALSRS